MMPTFYLMALGLTPEGADGGRSDCKLIVRKWQVGIWDWALLATEHKFGVPYQLADSWAHSCNLEFALEAEDSATAVEYFRAINVALLCAGIHPFATPIVSTHSINDLSNIKGAALDATDPRHTRAKIIASKREVVQTWRVALGSGGRGSLNARKNISVEDVESAAVEAEIWRGLVRNHAPLQVLEDTILSVPQTSDVGQGILQMWTGLESIFPRVDSEVSFKIALYLAQLQAGQARRLDYFSQAKKAYGVRSKVAHGGSLRGHSEENLRKWSESWKLLVDAYRSVVRRQGLPDEESLVAELLSDADQWE